mgnify:CR=1 FL=1
MKRDISDLLDCYREEHIDLDPVTPLSPSRVKELTMNRIKPKQSHSPRARMRVLVLAAAVALLSITALAAGSLGGAGIFFSSFFAQDSGDLTTGQVETMDRIGQTFEGGVTSNGTTMTPVAALADRYTYYLRLRVEAPEGVVLPDLDGDVDGYYQFMNPDEDIDIDLELEEGAYQTVGYSSQLEWLPDSNPTDNVKEVVILYTAQLGTDLAFNDGIPKVLTIHGLWIQSPYKEYTQVLEGEFSFDIGTHYQGDVVTLDGQGAADYNEAYGFTTVLDTLELSPLGFSYRLKSTVPENDWILPGLGRLQIVLKDGSVFWQTGEGVVYRDSGDKRSYLEEHGIVLLDTPTTEHQDHILFDSPLDLSQVDYVVYGDTVIPMEYP